MKAILSSFWRVNEKKHSQEQLKENSLLILLQRKNNYLLNRNWIFFWKSEAVIKS